MKSKNLHAPIGFPWDTRECRAKAFLVFSCEKVSLDSWRYHHIKTAPSLPPGLLTLTQAVGDTFSKKPVIVREVQAGMTFSQWKRPTLPGVCDTWECACSPTQPAL